MSQRRCQMSRPHTRFAHLLLLLSQLLRQAVWVSLGLAMFTLLGCEGCNSTDPEDLKAKEEARKKLEEAKKKKEELEIGLLQPLLGQELSEEDLIEGKPKLLVKPGHWMPTSQPMKANFDDFVLQSSNTLVDDNRQPVKLPLTPFTYEVARPVVLAKGRAKVVQGEVFIPEESESNRIRSTLLNTKNRANKLETFPELMKMPPYQYFLLVLAPAPERYTFLKVTDTVRSRWEQEYGEESLPHYRVSLAAADKELPLSPNALSWSTIAAVFWDDVDVSRINAEQQQALLDWLHWGGRLIVNGPDSLERLRGTFLDKYLPVDSKGTRKLTAADLSEWSAYWGVREQGAGIPPLAPVSPISGVNLAPREGARAVEGGGGLFYEKDVGLGSIVVSSIQLTQREFINWPGYDGFLNSALLARPRRLFDEAISEGIRVSWTDYPGSQLDAHFTTGVRMMARDAGAKANSRFTTSDANRYDLDRISEYTLRSDRNGGVAAWNSFGNISTTARSQLQEAAGVEMPGAGLVLFCVGVYLVVLVPLNWMIFRTIGRVELAWVAAPFIAILGTYGVVWMAQLDIGFVRAQTEIALLEFHGGYPRGIVTRYTAFYSSLSTTYDVKYDAEQSVGVPFATRLDRNDPSLRDQQYDVSFESLSSPHLKGLAITSNSTRMLHSEQIYAAEGGVRLGKSSRGLLQVENNTGLNLRDVVVMRRYFPAGEAEPAYKASWIGYLRSGNSEVLGLTDYDYNPDRLPFQEDRTQVEVGQTGQFDVDNLLLEAFQFPGKEDPRYNRREEIRLVGRIDEVLPGLDVTPSATQVQGTTVVVAHLSYGAPLRQLPDVNSRSDVMTEKPGLFDD